MAIAVIMLRGSIGRDLHNNKMVQKKGETVKMGDILFSYETDKARSIWNPLPMALFWKSSTTRGRSSGAVHRGFHRRTRETPDHQENNPAETR